MNIFICDVKVEGNSLVMCSWSNLNHKVYSVMRIEDKEKPAYLCLWMNDGGRCEAAKGRTAELLLVSAYSIQYNAAALFSCIIMNY
jgi:hypothetical protein